MMCGVVRAVAGAALMAGAVSSVSAESLTVNFEGLHFGNDSLTAQTNITTGTFHAGALNWSESAGQQRSFTTYCLEVTQLVQDPTTFTVQASPGGAGWFDNAPGDAEVRARLLQTLYNQWYADSFQSPTRSAAFQLAVWEVVYETELDFDLLDVTNEDGSFRVTGGSAQTDIDPALGLTATALANLYLNSAVADMDDTEVDTLRAWTSNEGQNQLHLIPLPGPAGLAMVGLLGAGAVRRRR